MKITKNIYGYVILYDTKVPNLMKQAKTMQLELCCSRITPTIYTYTRIHI